MKAKIAHAKEIVHKHRTKIVFCSGVLVGAGGILAWGHSLNNSPFEIFLPASTEALQKLIDNPNGAISWTHNTHGAVINVFNEANPTFQ